MDKLQEHIQSFIESIPEEFRDKFICLRCSKAIHQELRRSTGGPMLRQSVVSCSETMQLFEPATVIVTMCGAFEEVDIKRSVAAGLEALGKSIRIPIPEKEPIAIRCPECERLSYWPQHKGVLHPHWESVQGGGYACTSCGKYFCEDEMKARWKATKAHQEAENEKALPRDSKDAKGKDTDTDPAV